jgi:biofilm PGA synthesis N-glycosyltransferase PgaC
MICLASLSILVLFYTYLGYPIAIGLLARRRRPGTHPAEPAVGSSVASANDDDTGVGAKGPPLVTVLVPVYNGASYLPAKLDSLLHQTYPAARLEVLLYLDGCTDDSGRVAAGIAGSAEWSGRIRIVTEARRLGKPTGLNALARLARGELFLLNDVRQPLSPNAVTALVEAMSDPEVGCATGNLMLAGQHGSDGSGVYWRYEKWIRQQESRFRGVVGMTGSIGMIRRAGLAEPLPEDLILDDVWIPMRLVLAGRRTVFVAEAQAYDAAFANGREFMRKVRTLAGNYQVFSRLPALLSPGANPMWFETLSHKVCRLIAPWMMVVLFLSSALGTRTHGSPAGGMLLLLLVGQVAFYLAAVAGRRAGRLGGLARTFVVLNAAAVVGLWRYSMRRQQVTW